MVTSMCRSTREMRLFGAIDAQRTLAEISGTI
jgi:hypothetical protein